MLFVDDDERILNALRTMFRQDYEVHTTTSGEAALELAKRHDVHLIVSDQRMPGMTGVELLLWSRLRRKQLGGYRFRRQAPIGPYIADFACLQARLLIEIDGPAHDGRVEYDDRRTTWLEDRGFRVLRFAADEVLSKLDEVLEAILLELGDSAEPPPPASRVLPRLRGGETPWSFRCRRRPPPGSPCCPAGEAR